MGLYECRFATCVLCTVVIASSRLVRRPWTGLGILVNDIKVSIQSGKRAENLKLFHLIISIMIIRLTRGHPGLNWEHFDLQSNALPLSYTHINVNMSLPSTFWIVTY